MKPLRDSQLYTFVDTSYLHGRNPSDVARQLCDGGSDIIQLRAKKESRGAVIRFAEMVLPVTRAAGIPLVINDHFEIAKHVRADFVHLGQEDFFDAEVRHSEKVAASVGSPRLGLSSHSPDQAMRAIAARADYIAVGPVFATPTKPGRAPATLEYVRWAANNVAIPWFAIGGITLQTIDEVLTAGAKRVCVVSAILNSPDISATCREFKRRLC